MTAHLGAAPTLSTPETHILNKDINLRATAPETLPDEQFETRYEIQRTIDEVRRQRWRRVALQFPDEMLPHSARVYQLLARGLKSKPFHSTRSHGSESNVAVADASAALENAVSELVVTGTDEMVKLTILADTSYGSCCVDEIAAEHVDADAVIHYGRSCLSPTARLPAVYVYTRRDLDYDKALEAFKRAFSEPETRVIVTADVPYSHHVDRLCSQLENAGYTSIYAASIIHDPSSAVPNRTVPPSVRSDASDLRNWHLFHISSPPTSLLLTLTSTMASIKVFSTDNADKSSSEALARSTSLLLRRRYALITSLTTVSTWGILINTLSVKNYLSMVDHVKQSIAAAGKKSYLFVVGKINVAKVSNFAEIGGWVVIGCWESSLIDSKDFYRPIITPFELELALQGDERRVWTGQWRGDFDSVLDKAKQFNNSVESGHAETTGDDEEEITAGNASEEDSDEAPVFDLRTGKYVSKSRPMGRKKPLHGVANGSRSSTALSKRANGDLVAVNGVASPAAHFLAEKRTWKGLGSDFEVKYEDEEEEGGLIEEGRSGVAGGYTIGDSGRA